MAVKTLTIDDQLISAREGETLLEATHSSGIVIPTLCYLESVSTVGACRLCLVEVEGTHKLLPACVMTVEEGMVARSQTDRLKRYRRMIVELPMITLALVRPIPLTNFPLWVMRILQETPQLWARLALARRIPKLIWRSEIMTQA